MANAWTGSPPDLRCVRASAAKPAHAVPLITSHWWSEILNTPGCARWVTTLHKRVICTTSLVSSATSRITTSTSDSLCSTRPPDTGQRLRPGTLARRIGNSLLTASCTIVSMHPIAGASNVVIGTGCNRSHGRHVTLTPVRYKSPHTPQGAVQTFWHGHHNERTGLVDMNLKKLVIWAGVALALFFLLTAPLQASNLVTHVLDLLKNAAEAAVAFVKTLFS